MIGYFVNINVYNIIKEERRLSAQAFYFLLGGSISYIIKTVIL